MSGSAREGVDEMEVRGGEVRGVAAETIDRLSLEQALTDAEIAIARSRDLAMRLVELPDELAAKIWTIRQAIGV